MNIYLAHYFDYSEVNLIGAFDSFQNAFDAIIKAENRVDLPSIEQTSENEWDIDFPADDKHCPESYFIKMVTLNQRL